MPHKIVAADQSVTIRRAIELTFRDMEIEILQPGGRHELETMLRTHRPEVLVLDHQFLGQDFEAEFATLGKVLEQLGTFSILMARLNDEVTLENVRQLGIADVLLKPLDNAELRSKIVAFLQEQHGMEEPEPAPIRPGTAAVDVDAESVAEAVLSRLAPALSDLAVASSDEGGGLSFLEELADRVDQIQRSVDNLEEQVSVSFSKVQSDVLEAVLLEVREAIVAILEGGDAGEESGESETRESLPEALERVKTELMDRMQGLDERLLTGATGEGADTTSALGEVLEPRMEQLTEELDRRAADRQDALFALLREEMTEKMGDRGSPVDLAADALGQELDARLPSTVDGMIQRINEVVEQKLDDLHDRTVGSVTEQSARLAEKMEESSSDLSLSLRSALAEPLAEAAAEALGRVLDERMPAAAESLLERMAETLGGAGTEQQAERDLALQNLLVETSDKITGDLQGQLEVLPSAIAESLTGSLLEAIQLALTEQTAALTAELQGAGEQSPEQLEALAEQVSRAVEAALAERGAVELERLEELHGQFLEQMSERIAGQANEQLAARVDESLNALQESAVATLGQGAGEQLEKIGEEIQAEAAVRLEAALGDLGPAVQSALQERMEEILQPVLETGEGGLLDQIAERMIQSMDLEALGTRVEEAVHQKVLEIVPDQAISLMREAIAAITAPPDEDQS